MVCKSCNCEKPESEFYDSSLKNNNYKCIECTKSYNERRKKEMTPEQRKMSNHKKNARRMGITLEKYITEYEMVEKSKSLGKKYCYECSNIKSLDEFNKHKGCKDGLNTKCRECQKKITTDYYVNNLNTLTEKKKEYYILNTKKIKLRTKSWIEKKILENPLEGFKLKCRQRIYSSLKKRLKNKTGKTSKSHITDLLGCDISFFVTYIENQFSEGMTWDNWNIKTWHLDHIIPLKDAKTEEEVIKLCHYKNFQPLWVEDNYKKNRKYKR
jgi:hypothetical protein